MAIFSGKIIEAYYTNSDNTAVEVIYKDGPRAINHYLAVDGEHPDFQDLVSEYPLAKLAETTVMRNKEALVQLNRVVDARVKLKMEDEPLKNFDSVLDFVLNYDSKKHAEELFNLKLKIFDKKNVKEFSGNEEKKNIRQAKTPLDVLLAYKDIVEKQN
jgi:hypothetical protein